MTATGPGLLGASGDNVQDIAADGGGVWRRGRHWQCSRKGWECKAGSGGLPRASLPVPLSALQQQLEWLWIELSPALEAKMGAWGGTEVPQHSGGRPPSKKFLLAGVGGAAGREPWGL